MHFNSFIAASILAFSAKAFAWTEEDYSLYAREAGLVDQDYGYGYDLYSREAEPEPEPEAEFEIDYLHPRDAYEYGLYVGELQARSAYPSPDKQSDQKKKDMKTYTSDAKNQDKLKAKEDSQRLALKKASQDLANTVKTEQKNNAQLSQIGKKFGARSLYERDW